MAGKKANRPPNKAGEFELSGQIEKLARLLALSVTKGESQPEKIRLLSVAGFSNVEIASLLNISSNTVNIALHRLRAK